MLPTANSKSGQMRKTANSGTKLVSFVSGNKTKIEPRIDQNNMFTASLSFKMSKEGWF